MGWTTAPVAGSGPWPTCSARVAKPHLSIPNEVGGFGVTSWGPLLPWSVKSALAAVRDELEQVGPRDHRDRPPRLDHEHGLLAPEQRLERVVERGVHGDLAHRCVHRG